MGLWTCALNTQDWPNLHGICQDMLSCDQNAQLMVLARIMSETLHAGQEVRVLGENYSFVDEEDSYTL
ncbi:116 kda U5 small nuclear ribonucleoprotein component [Culex quinquefasciatus]|uniref:116 kDa U5 small nuclear ribonucleoprotein component n=1 Tax=Culex quinquefasciatus TaxID=7176 RepID=B0X7U5_CULQU|nr:116 kda U5 small nuclear ribonucleoprotein component [Culex quinquefasciatus]|eukprot:XP_001865717.1 116 kda U5 small nuclear ribonucleoprotein component [Culex quinquefasciatus]